MQNRDSPCSCHIAMLIWSPTTKTTTNASTSSTSNQESASNSSNSTNINIKIHFLTHTIWKITSTITNNLPKPIWRGPLPENSPKRRSPKEGQICLFSRPRPNDVEGLSRAYLCLETKNLTQARTSLSMSLLSTTTYRALPSSFGTSRPSATASEALSCLE
mmetsp:Transcript_82774/g.181918  ORF Transcript_82774/g.181918 Transcript_82774/m.181918 type:complete len:161 (-) Transcript_82774:552-1034(-)